jgi:hypothetical protein
MAPRGGLNDHTRPDFCTWMEDRTLVLARDRADTRDSEPALPFTGHLPLAERVQQLVRAAYDQLKTNDTQRIADHHLVLAARFLSRQLGLKLFASQLEG